MLANRSTFSAANNFVSVMKLLPGVRVVGATTGGGSACPTHQSFRVVGQCASRLFDARRRAP
ncbi:hypothetical protein [Duncaniella dubosii]|uniref:hypothetical protein n=1 Tax=Duncaniella dubosii TaxID=2518971 RepID=UPI003F6745B6